MAKEGSVAPKERINVTFKPSTGGAQEEIELPLKLLAIGDYTHRKDERKVEDRKPISIDKMTFDEVLAKQELELTLSVPNRLQEESNTEELAVKVSVNSMKDFSPASLVEQVPELKKLMELRDALVALKGPLGNAPAFRKAIEGVLADDESRDRAARGAGASVRRGSAWLGPGQPDCRGDPPMTELMRPIDDLLVSEEQDNNLTYFAFAKSLNGEPHKAEPALAPPRASVGELPDVLAGRYRIERLLGAGGMGAVYRARDLLNEQFGDPDPYIALKILSEEFAESPDASALLYSEFALTRRLRHDNVLRFHTFEVDTDCQRAFITMELMRGLTLDKFLCERATGLPWKELRAIALPLLDALAYAHARGVLHGDMKPSNVMLSEEGVRLFDFGLGQAEKGIMPGLPHLSRERFNAWTPGYAAPELLEGLPLSASADVYAVACVIYELAGGQHPFRGLPLAQPRNESLERELRAPQNLPKHCWPALRAALAIDVADRTITVRQLRDAFAVTSSWLQRLIHGRNV